MLFMVMMLILIVYMLFYFISYKMFFNMDSSSGYECGFNFISLTRMMFSYRFFLIGMLFLIFDVEIILLLCIPYMIKNFMSSLYFMIFMLILILGLLYEYFMGSLEWVN